MAVSIKYLDASEILYQNRDIDHFIETLVTRFELTRNIELNERITKFYNYKFYNLCEIIQKRHL